MEVSRSSSSVVVESGRELSLAGVAEASLGQLVVSLRKGSENLAKTSLVLGPELGASLHHQRTNDDLGELVALGEIEEGHADSMVEDLTNGWVAALDVVQQIGSIAVSIVLLLDAVDDLLACLTHPGGVENLVTQLLVHLEEFDDHRLGVITNLDIEIALEETWRFVQRCQ